MNQNILLNNKDFYSFNVNENIPFTFGINRFELLFTQYVNGVETLFSNENNMVIFPNPVTHLLHIKFMGASLLTPEFSYALSNQLGQEMKAGLFSFEKGDFLV